MAEGQNFARNVEEKSENQSKEGPDHETARRAAIGKGLLHARTFMNAAGIEHPVNAAGNEDDERQDEIDDFPVSFRHILPFIVPIFFRHFDLPVRAKFVFRHGEIVTPAKEEEDHKKHREPCVQIEGDGLEKQGKPIDVRVFGKRGCDGGGPAGNGCNDTNRCRRRIDDIRQLRARDLEFVRDGTHDGADGEAVEIIVDKNQNAEPHRDEKRARLAANRRRRPFAVSPCGPTRRDSFDENAEQHEEDQNVYISADGI